MRRHLLDVAFQDGHKLPEFCFCLILILRVLNAMLHVGMN